MASRLDKLFLLLENGTTPLTRRAAANQLGEVQRLHPHELPTLLNKLTSYLRSPNWETRMAASQAVEAIVKNVPQWLPDSRVPPKCGPVSECAKPLITVKLESDTETGPVDQVDPPAGPQRADRLKFSRFDINTVMDCGHNLLACDATEFDAQEFEAQQQQHLVQSGPAGSGPPEQGARDRLLRQKQLLNARLGLGDAQKFGVDTSELFSMADLEAGTNNWTTAGPTSVASNNHDSRSKIEELIAKASNRNQSPNPAANNTTIKRRKSDQNHHDHQQQLSIASGGNSSTTTTSIKPRSTGSYKRFKSSPSSSRRSSSDSSASGVGPVEIVTPGTDDWPLDGFFEQLLCDLFSPSWEVRHGAATAMREILKHHGRCGGRKRTPMPSDPDTEIDTDYSTDNPLKQVDQDQLNQAWLEDVALRLICVLALDRFGDFVSDQVVAPVRETCAQTLGSVMNVLDRDGVTQVLRLLRDLLARREWEARHGALLGIKYLLAVRQDLTRDLLPGVFSPIFQSLQDGVDDVSAVAAAALIPVRETLKETLPDRIPAVINYLWDSLAHLDDLTSSTSSILLLLSSLLSYPGGPASRQTVDTIIEQPTTTLPTDLTELVPRLWPFIGHSMVSVRKSVLEALLTLTAHRSPTDGRGRATVLTWLTVPILSEVLRLLFQRSLIESVDEICDLIYKTWRQIIVRADICRLVDASCGYMSGWIVLMMHPARIPIDCSSSVVWFWPGPGGSTGGDSDPIYLGGGGSPSVTSGQDLENQATKARLLASRCLGLLSVYATEDIHAESPTPVECFCNVLLFHLNSRSAIQRMAVGWILTEWARAAREREREREETSDQTDRRPSSDTPNGVSLPTSSLPDQLIGRILTCLGEAFPFDEVGALFARLQTDVSQFCAYLDEHNRCQPSSSAVIVPADDDDPDRTWCSLISSAGHQSVDQISELLKRTIPEAMSRQHGRLSKTVEAGIEERRRNVLATLDELRRNWSNLSVRSCSSLACSLTAWRYKPDNWNPIIRPLMESIKREPNEALQRESAAHLIRVLDTLTRATPSVAAKMTKNLILYLCNNPDLIPNLINTAGSGPSLLVPSTASAAAGNGSGENSSDCPSPAVPSTPATPSTPLLTSDGLGSGVSSSSCGIMTLTNMQRASDRILALRRTNSTVGRRPNPTTAANSELPTTSGPDGGQEEVSATDTTPIMAAGNGSELTALDIQHRGATMALSLASDHFAGHLPERLPHLWQHISLNILEHLPSAPTTSGVNGGVTELDLDHDHARELVNGLQVLEVIAPSLHPDLRSHLTSLLRPLTNCLRSAYPQVRHIASRSFGVLGQVIPAETMDIVLDEVILRHLSAAECDTSRKGAIETVYCLIDRLRLEIIPYVVLLIVPVLGRMADQCEEIRRLATHCFASLIQLLPLDSSDPEAELQARLKPDLARRRVEEKHFLQQLMNHKRADDYRMPCKIHADLRSYQQEGVNWLAFLKRYNLHGILCDEMGLGKTLMSICILAAEHYETRQEVRKDRRSRSRSTTVAKDHDNGSEPSQPSSTTGRPLRSIVICPPTLTGHWVYEVKKFISPTYLRPIHYTGPPAERQRLRNKILENSTLPDESDSDDEQDDTDDQRNRRRSRKRPQEFYNLVIVSYDIVRNDIEFFSRITWNYCILDEGHVIKNGKTKMSRAIRLLRSAHRLILTGTPIQNNVLELWSLFDFLMPGFLGSEKSFLARYSRPILLSRDARSSSREQQAGVLAAEALHRQVLPFILRRMKEDVLQDLPPKIIQDYYCPLSSLQAMLYEDFAKSQVRHQLQESMMIGPGGPAEDGLVQDGDQNVRAGLRSGSGPGPGPGSGPAVGKSKSGMPSHVFQALQYLRKVCNHPKLVLLPGAHPEYDRIMSQLSHQSSAATSGLAESGSGRGKSANQPLDDIAHSAKLVALRQLLLDCGIGSQSSPLGSADRSVATAAASVAADVSSLSVVNQHRALIFCQLKSMLDIVERDLIRSVMPSVTYLRLDGSVPPGERHDVVHRFNNDPSIDVLLLTTQVGGLGLNLTGADTVIFVEHDWNPMKDLQAMDRAHRIGQKKVVNVYRLITSGTLEEKIMSLQKFKLGIANTVISQDNSSLSSMATHELLDLFNLDHNLQHGGGSGSGGPDENGGRKGSNNSTTSGVKSILDSLPELHDSKQYDSEYDLTNFIQSLKRK